MQLQSNCKYQLFQLVYEWTSFTLCIRIASFAIAQSRLLCTFFLYLIIWTNWLYSIVWSQVHPTKNVGELEWFIVRRHVTVQLGFVLHVHSYIEQFKFGFTASSSFQWALFLTQPTTIFKASLRCYWCYLKTFGID